MATGCLRRGLPLSARLISVELLSHFWIGVGMIPEVQAREEELSARLVHVKNHAAPNSRGPVLAMLVIVQIKQIIDRILFLSAMWP